MSQVDGFIREKILAYPNSYTNRTEVLHHALCALDSGYCWSEDGTVVTAGDSPVPVWSKERELERIEQLIDDLMAVLGTDSTVSRDSLRAEFIVPIERAKKVVQEVDSRVHMKGNITNFYWDQGASLLRRIPANVTEDWREACDEIRELAIENGWKFS